LVDEIALKDVMHPRLGFLFRWLLHIFGRIWLWSGTLLFLTLPNYSLRKVFYDVVEQEFHKFMCILVL
jgi:hypothetical protein